MCKQSWILVKTGRWGVLRDPRDFRHRRPPKAEQEGAWDERAEINRPSLDTYFSPAVALDCTKSVKDDNK